MEMQKSSNSDFTVDSLSIDIKKEYSQTKSEVSDNSFYTA